MSMIRRASTQKSAVLRCSPPRSPISPHRMSVPTSGRALSAFLLLVGCSVSFFALEAVGDVIGDGRTSDSSSQEFFSTLDVNADGTVEEHELIGLVTGFGGKSLDEPDEIQRSVKHAFKRLDANRDGALSVAESNQFWRQLGHMLSVAEVAEWVVHGVQLPPLVGQIFRDHAVTGYDFAELVEGDGEALAEELGIERTSYRKKLVRSMRMMMSGVGVSPDWVSSQTKDSHANALSAEPKGCASVRLRWSKSDGKGFPVHKYRLFRHADSPTGLVVANAQLSAPSLAANPAAAAAAASQTNHLPSSALLPAPSVGLTAAPTKTSRVGRSESVLAQGEGGSIEGSGGSSGRDASRRQVNGAEENESLSSATVSQSLQWKLVFDGAENEFVDGGELLSGQLYEYKVVAWNLFGHSEARFVTGSPTLSDPATGKACSNTRRRSLFGSSSSAFGLLSRSSGSGGEELGLVEAAWWALGDWLSLLWWTLSAFASWATFVATAVTTFLGLVMSLMRARRAGMFNNSSSSSPTNKTKTSPHGYEPDAADKWYFEVTRRVLVGMRRWLPFVFRLLPTSLLLTDPTDPRFDHGVGRDGHASPSAVGTAGVRNVQPPEVVAIAKQQQEQQQRRRSSSNSSGGDGGTGKKDPKSSHGVSAEDPWSCHECGKKLLCWSSLGKHTFRARHTCGNCLASFCASCGCTNHTWLTSCPVGGGCLCAPCDRAKQQLLRQQSSLSPVRSRQKTPSSSDVAAAVAASAADAAALYPPAPQLSLPPFARDKNATSNSRVQSKSTSSVSTLEAEAVDKSSSSSPVVTPQRLPRSPWSSASLAHHSPTGQARVNGGGVGAPPSSLNNRAVSEQIATGSSNSSSGFARGEELPSPSSMLANRRSVSEQLLPLSAPLLQSPPPSLHLPPKTNTCSGSSDDSRLLPNGNSNGGGNGNGATSGPHHQHADESSQATCEPPLGSVSVRKKKAVERWGIVRKALSQSAAKKEGSSGGMPRSAGSHGSFSSLNNLFGRRNRGNSASSAAAAEDTD